MRLKPCAPSADGDSSADRAATVGKDQGMPDLHAVSRSQQLDRAIHAPSGSVPPRTVLPDSAPWS